MIAGVTPRTTVAVFAGSFAFRRTLPPYLSSRKGAAATRTPGTSNSTLNPTTRRPALGRRSRQVTMAASSSSSGLLAVHVSVKVKEGMEDDFIAASLANATNSVQEPGVSRFDLIREVGDPKNFTLVEVYNKDDAPAAHKETAHYAAWRDAVADMMAEPRTNVKYETILPANEDGWAVPSALSSGQKEAGEAKDLIDVHVFVSVKPDCVEAFKAASIENATNSINEPGVTRFDFLQEKDDPTKFALVEVYNSDDAPAAHKETAHYNKWRETVADMMAEPRTNTKFVNVFPATEDGWAT